MKNYILLFFILLSFCCINLNCHSPTEPKDKNNKKDNAVIINGQVLNKVTYTPIDSAVVRVINIYPEIVQITDSLGNYSIELPIDSTINIEVIAFKESFFNTGSVMI